MILAELHLYIYVLCLSVCLLVCPFVSNKLQNGWTDRAQFFWNLTWPQGRFMDDRIFTNLLLIKLDFWKFWKSTILIIREFFCFVLHCIQRENVFKWNRRWAWRPWKPSIFIFIYLSIYHFKDHMIT